MTKRTPIGRYPSGLPMPLEEVRKRHILRTLQYCNGNKSQAARLLEIDVKTLRSRLKQYDEE